MSSLRAQSKHPHSTNVTSVGAPPTSELLRLGQRYQYCQPKSTDGEPPLHQLNLASAREVLGGGQAGGRHSWAGNRHASLERGWSRDVVLIGQCGFLRPAPEIWLISFPIIPGDAKEREGWAGDWGGEGCVQKPGKVCTDHSSATDILLPFSSLDPPT